MESDMINHRIGWIHLLPAIVLLVGCAHDKQTVRVTTGIEDPAMMQSTIVKNIPNGTQLADAKRFMQSEGFKCSITRNGSFSDRDSIDYIYCDRLDRVDDWVSRRWQIALVLEDDAIADVSVSHGLIGP